MKNNPFNEFTVHELTAIIDDTIFDKDWDRDIALNIYVRSMTAERCAEVMAIDYKTVQKRAPRIKDRICATIFRSSLKNVGKT
jgi:hypothetical protein